MKNKLHFFLVMACTVSCTAFAQTPSSWTSLNGPYGFFSPQSILCHQGAVLASSNTNGSTGSGLWRSLNGGANWTDVSAGLAMPYARDIIAFGADLFAASDTGVYKSSNLGATWVAADSLLPDYSYVYEMVVHQGELYAGAYLGTGNTDLYKSSNNGLSWSATGYTFGFASTLNHLYSSGNTLWASTTAGIYKSLDGGVTFNYAGNNIPFNASITSLAALGDTAYCGTSSGTYFTLNGGVLWNPVNIPTLPSPVYTYSWLIRGNTVFAGLSNSGVYSAPVGQSNFTPFGNGYLNANLPWMMSHNNTDLYVASAEGIFSCPLSGGNWVDKNGDITRARTTFGFAEGNLLLAGSGFYSGIKRSANGGANWSNTSLNNVQGIYRAGIKVNNKIFIPGSYNLYSSTDNGLTWQSPSVAPIPNNDICVYGNYLVAPSGSKVAYSDDLGVSWNYFSGGLPVSGTTYSVGVMGQSAYAGINNSVYKMETPGAAWTNFSQGISGNGLVRDILSLGSTLVMNNTLAIYRRTAEDSLWRLVNPFGYYTDIASVNGFIFGATGNGVEFSDDLGKTFHPWNNGFPAHIGAIENLFADGKTLYAGSMSFSAWKRDADPELTITSSLSAVHCTGSTLTVSAQTNLTLDPGNKYYLQLSDSLGRFINPLKLDSVSSNASPVTLNGILPDTLISSPYYRVRIVSTSPYLLATDNGYNLSILQRPQISLQPANQNPCDGQGSGFYVAAAGDGLSYQWQVDATGSGSYVNLSNNALYQDVNTSLLLILNAQVSMNGYRYRCTISGTCGTIQSNYGVLNVNTGTATVIAQPLPDTVCSGSASAFSIVASGTGLSYQWQVNSGAGFYTNLTNNSQYGGVNTANLSVNFTNGIDDGNLYRCRIGLCTYSDSALLSVSGIPVTGTVLSPRPYCDGGSTSFAVSVAGSGIGYQWEVDNGSGFTSLSNGANYNGVNSSILDVLNIPAIFNNYQYRCVISGNCPPFSSVSNSASLQLNPTPQILQQPLDDSACDGDSAEFSLTGAGSFLSYNWELNNGSGWLPVPPLAPYSGNNTATLQIGAVDPSLQTTLYRCRLSSCVTSDSVSVSVLPNPVVTASDVQVCLSNLPLLLNAGWPAGGSYFGYGIYSNTFNPSGAYAGNYIYDYSFEAANGCSGLARGTITLDACLSVQATPWLEGRLLLYPNPATDRLHVNAESMPAANILCEIFDLKGQLYSRFTLMTSQEDHEINISGLPPGMYLIRLLSSGAIRTGRFVKLP
ncbi:MAG: T9SS type A sorting domain-containing protein [Bacteroidia bacterium]|nr:T9SS type A sorting domain-containing protein [Bacteroidia bacterium]